MQQSVRGDDRVTCYEDLGVYRLLGEVKDTAAVERFVRQWLGALLDYDARKRSELVPTLCRYLERGGSYDGSAAALSVHRSTLKYRLSGFARSPGMTLRIRIRTSTCSSPPGMADVAEPPGTMALH